MSNSIIKKLEDLGWGIDIAGIRDPDYLEDHKHVNKAQRLTEKSMYGNYCKSNTPN